jgi:uncharacterized protein (DUF924 family)
LQPREQQFLYMPFMHREGSEIQRRLVELFLKIGRPGAVEFAERHKAVIARFPTRNKALKRESTAAELEFISARPGR